jgi:YbgC/YbaW family acyl-CoA thioester hydrolase
VPKPPFKFSASTRVGFSDTDAQGVVYYGRYMPYFDLARVEYHRQFTRCRPSSVTASS